MSASRHHLFVCTSCRAAGEPKEPREHRSGSRLYQNLVTRFAGWARRENFAIVPYECLSVCPRPCGVAMRAEGKFTYVFGDLNVNEHEGAIVECATLYRRAPNGFLPREDRPHALRGSILARVPPLEDST